MEKIVRYSVDVGKDLRSVIILRGVFVILVGGERCVMMILMSVIVVCV